VPSGVGRVAGGEVGSAERWPWRLRQRYGRSRSGRYSDYRKCRLRRSLASVEALLCASVHKVPMTRFNRFQRVAFGAFGISSE
jgi:hypothetical protein